MATNHRPMLALIAVSRASTGWVHSRANTVEQSISAAAAARVHHRSDRRASQTKMAMEGTGAHGSWAGDSLLQYGKIITPAEALATWQAVTAEEIREVVAGMLESPRAMAEIRP